MQCRYPSAWTRLCAVWLLLMGSVLAGSVSADSVLELPVRGVVNDVKSHSLVRFDPDHALDAVELLASPEGFVPFEPAFNASAPATWLLLNLKPAADSNGQYVLRVSRRFFTGFELHAPDATGQRVLRLAGVMDKAGAGTVGRELVFELALEPGVVTPILLHVDLFQGSLQPLELSFQDAASFSQTRANTYLLFGLIFGILIALILHNLALYLNLRQPGHFYYVLAMTSLLLLLGVDSGLMQNYLLPDFALPWVGRLNVFLAAMMVVTIFLFFRAFADADRLVPRLVTIGWWLVALLSVLAVGQWFVGFSLFPLFAIGAQLVNVSIFGLLLIAGWLAGRRGSVEGYVFLLAWSVFLFSAFGRTLLSLDVTGRNLVLEYSMYFGAVIEASILGLGLAYRVRQLYESHALALKEQHRAARLANLDPLTGAYNRRFLQAYLDNAIADAREGDFKRSILILDLDRFKETNDLYGHAAGDTLLKDLVTRCQNHLREGDVLCRLGGDEFVVVSGGSRPGEGLALARRIVESIHERPFKLDGQPLPVTVSIGVVSGLFANDQVSDLLRKADQALYQAKQAGRNRAVLFDPDKATPFRHGPSMSPPEEQLQ